METWFEAKLSYLKINENGVEKKVTETYLFRAVSFTDAETIMTQEARKMVKGGFAIKDIKQSNISEVNHLPEGEWWYKAKVSLLTIDEETGKEKRINDYHLISADDMDEALKRTNESLSYLVIPFEVTSLSKSTITDVLISY